MTFIDQQRSDDLVAVELLLDEAFGINRKNKASYNLRENIAPIKAYSWVVRATDMDMRALLPEGVMATIRFWPVTIRDQLTGGLSDAVLLGPLAVHPLCQGVGLGSQLLSYALGKVDRDGVGRVLLVGDESYYGAFGFVPVTPRHISLPGGLDTDRLLVRESGGQTSMPTVGELVPYTEDELLETMEAPIGKEQKSAYAMV